MLESIWTSAGIHRIHARCAIKSAPLEAHPIVLVHGLGMSHRYMMPTLRALAPNAPVFAPDLPGFGLSDKPSEALDIKQLAGALALWLRINNLHSAALVGNSFGCQIIAELASQDYGVAPRALVLIAPTIDRRARTISRQVFRLVLDAPRERLSLLPLAIREYLFTVGFRRALATLRFAIADRIEDKLPRIACAYAGRARRARPACSSRLDGGSNKVAAARRTRCHQSRRSCRQL
jgi:pimeloyl-ACP methyl ester carboxylesterase